MNFHHAATARAVARARWLNELVQALESAATLALELGDERAHRSAAVALGARIAALRGEVETMLSGRAMPDDEIPSEWTF